MENRYHHKLKLPVAFVPKDLNIEIPSHIKYKVSDVNQDLIDFLKSLGVSVLASEVFARPAGTDGGTHLDGAVETAATKINYVYGQGTMNWHQLKPGKKLYEYHTAINTMYLYSMAVDNEIVWSANIDETGSLVNVGGLHSVTDITTPRICYCLMLGDMAKNNTSLQWDRAIELFKGYY